MTTYAVDGGRQRLVVSWGTGRGHVATSLAVLEDVDEAHIFQLASALTGLSAELWRCYEFPASASKSLEINSEGWRRQENREAFDNVIPTLERPTVQEGDRLISYIPVQYAADRVADALGIINEPSLSKAGIDDVASELNAVEACELGDLSGRGTQAVLLNRESASPVQVSAAHDLLEDDPLGSPRLLQEVEPTAAAIAAARWLHAAAGIAAAETGAAIDQIVQMADDIEPMPVTTLEHVLKAMEAGASATDVVTGLIREAVFVADGSMPLESMADIWERAERLREITGRIGDPDDETLVRLSILDPRRPALDLLEDLLEGIRGCGLLYVEETASDSYDAIDGEESDENEDSDDDGSATAWDMFKDILRDEKPAGASD